MSIRILNSSVVGREDSLTIIRGEIHPDDLSLLLVDEYQRERLGVRANRHIYDALRAGEHLPDAELNMRGTRFRRERDTIYLDDPVYLIDGQQRRDAIVVFNLANSNRRVTLGCTVTVGKSREWEIRRFQAVNAFPTKVSTSVDLKGLAILGGLVNALHSLSENDPTFPLRGRIGWGQKLSGEQLMSAASFLRIGLNLHHWIPRINVNSTASFETMERAAAFLERGVGNDVVVSNVREFFSVVDRSWDLRAVHRRKHGEMPAHLKIGFLMPLVRFLARYPNFWSGMRLSLHSKEISRLKNFRVDDREIVRLSGSGGAAQGVLYTMLLDHMNKRRPEKLKERGIVEIGGERYSKTMPTVTAPGSKYAVIAAAVIDILESNGRFMRTRELYDVVRNRPEEALLASGSDSETKRYSSFSGVVSKMINEGSILRIAPADVSGGTSRRSALVGLEREHTSLHRP